MDAHDFGETADAPAPPFPSATGPSPAQTPKPGALPPRVTGHRHRQLAPTTPQKCETREIRNRPETEG